MVKKRVGVLGGTFDPVHFGHLNLAIAVQEALDLDEVLFVPALISPFKLAGTPQASAADRLEMLKLALSPLPKFRVCDEELKRPAPSYTIDTIKHLSSNSHLLLHLIISDEHLAKFPLWKEADKLALLAPLIVVSRSLSSSAQGLPSGAQFVKIPNLEISSTAIRHRLNHHLYCGHLLPAPVLNYIFNYKLYGS